MASYHAAFAAGGDLVEFPMLDFPLGTEMLGDQARIVDGRLLKPTAPGIGRDAHARNGSTLSLRSIRRLQMRADRFWPATRRKLETTVTPTFNSLA